MTRLQQSGTTPDYLRTAVEYRDQLKAELSKVEEFLRAAHSPSAAAACAEPDFFLLDYADPPGSLH